MDFGVAMGYGVPPHPDFWLGAFNSGEGFCESHIAFTASDRATVRAFFDAAVAVGIGGQFSEMLRRTPALANAAWR